MLLKDKIIIVSGIGPGLGVKLAIEAARAGAAGVVLAARSTEKLEQAEQQILALNTGCRTLKVATDITNAEQCAALALSTVQAFGRIDALINSAYEPGGMTKSIQDADLSDWSPVMDTNLMGTITITKAIVPQMKLQKSGAIVMINSLVTRKPLMGQAVYAVSKGALGVASKYLALELGKFGIRVNTVSMGWMWGTPVERYMNYVAETQKVSVADQKAAVVANIPLGHMPTDDDCAKAALFMASDYAAAVTGAWLDVNGGELPSCF